MSSFLAAPSLGSLSVARRLGELPCPFQHFAQEASCRLLVLSFRNEGVEGVAVLIDATP